MVVQPPQTQIAPTGTNVPSNGQVGSRGNELRSDGLGITGPAAPAERLLDIAVGEVRNDDQPQARARRDQQEAQVRPERFFSDSDEPIVEALLAENRLVPRGTFVNVVI
ncbi:MAG: hypothetical protein AAF213_13685 [Pseudomonadota bacterium]